MKKIMILTAALMTAVVMQAQLNIEYIDNDMASLMKPGKEIKKENKEEKNVRRFDNEPVNYQVKEQLYKDFSDITDVEWSHTSNFDEAAFFQDGQRLRAYYDIDGNLVGTTSIKTFSDLPENAQKDILKHYKDYSIERVILFDDNESNDTNMIYMDNQFDDEDNYFVELKNESKDVILRVSTAGYVFLFQKK